LLALVLVIVLILMSSCTGTGVEMTGGDDGANPEDPTPIPPMPAAEKPTYTVQKGSIIDSLEFTGRVSPAQEQSYYFKASGRVLRVMVERGDEVVSGTVLAELENDDLVRQLDQAKLDLQAAEMQLASARAARDYNIARAAINLRINKLQLSKLTSGANDIDVQLATVGVQRAEAALRRAQAAYDLRAQKPGVEASYEALALEQATLDVQTAQTALDRAKKARDTAGYDVAILEQQIKAAELELSHLSNSDDVTLQGAVSRASLAVERLQAFVDDTRIVSTMDGTVTSVSAEAGKAVEAYTVMFVVSNASQMEIRAEPLATQMEKMQEGQEVKITLSQYPGKELTGTVVKLPYPYGTGGGAPSETGTRTAEQIDKSTHIEFIPGELELKPGDLVKIVVTLEEKDDVLWLPPIAIRTFSGRKFVVISEDGNQRRVDIVTGIETTERVEIKEGLQEGQVVIGQ